MAFQKILFTKMTGLAINGPPAFLAYGTFLCKDQLCYQRVCEHTSHTSRSPAYSWQSGHTLGFSNHCNDCGNYFMDKISSKRHVKSFKFLVRKIFKKKSGAKKHISFHETRNTVHHSSNAWSTSTSVSKNILGLIIQPFTYLFCNLKPWLPQCAGQPPERPLESLDAFGEPCQKYDLISPMGPTTAKLIEVITVDSDRRDYYWHRDGNRPTFYFSA